MRRSIEPPPRGIDLPCEENKTDGFGTKTLNEGNAFKNPTMKRQITLPKHLSAEARKMGREIAAEYGIEDAAGLRILVSGLEAWDRATQARQAIDREGMTLTDRWGQVKTHPLCTVERDARAQFLASLKQLNLDLEPLRDKPGRPPGR
jgi:P27 family predicted phage terminase small subunit